MSTYTMPAHNGTDTSREAAASVAGKTICQRMRIMEHIICSNGATCDDLEVALGMSHQATSARLVELKNAGRILDLGERKKTRSGRNAVAWYAAGVAK